MVEKIHTPWNITHLTSGATPLSIGQNFSKEFNYKFNLANFSATAYVIDTGCLENNTELGGHAAFIGSFGPGDQFVDLSRCEYSSPQLYVFVHYYSLVTQPCCQYLQQLLIWSAMALPHYSSNLLMPLLSLLDGTLVTRIIGGGFLSIAKQALVNCIKILKEKGADPIKAGTLDFIPAINLALATAQAHPKRLPSVILAAWQSVENQVLDIVVCILSLNWLHIACAYVYPTGVQCH